MLLLAAAGASADVALSVDVGFGGAFRIGYWNPLFLMISDAAPRAVEIEVYSAPPTSSSMLVRQRMTIGPAPTTFPIYLPISQDPDSIAVVVRDLQTQRRVAEWPDPDRTQVPQLVRADDRLIVVSGRGSALRAIDGRGGSDATSRFLEPARLPAVAQGYDAVSLLVLNQPDFNRLRAEQQSAIAAWVRGGGSLVMWPAADPIPASSPIIEILPARIGDNGSYNVAPEKLAAAGLAKRFARIPGRVLDPRPGAQPLRLLDTDDLTGYRHRAGFGQVLLLPIDPSLLVFADTQAALRFWKHVLGGFVVLREADDTSNRVSYWNDPVLTRRANAIDSVMDLLGNVPGIGSFGFGYIAAVLIALMIIVGPVDWFVLKFLGRQPWTWFTTAGWIALVTTGAVLIGYLFRSGDLHFRTLRIVDQADGAVVATTDMAGIYSPRTQLYELNVDPASWWQPASDPRNFRRGVGSTVPFRQDYRGNVPDPSSINVWTLRFLQSDMHLTAPPVIDAALRLEHDDSGHDHVRGTVRNLSRLRMHDMIVRVNDKSVASIPGTLEPGGQISLDARVTTTWTSNDKPDPAAPNAAWTWCQVASLRSERIDAILAGRGDLACVYAQVENPPAAATLANPGAIEQHWQIVRALVRLTREQK